jgi:uncharacterized membrane protein YhaH (DUF805 family)
MINHTMNVLRKYATFSGRASRAEFWYFALAQAIVFFTIALILALWGFSDEEIDLISNLLFLTVALPNIAVAVRRVHDVNKSGWFILVPVYNLILYIRKGDEGENRFGPSPYANLSSDTSVVSDIV